MGEERAPKRLLMTTDAVGGIWRYSLDLIGALTAQSNIEILLAALGPSPSEEQKSEALALPRIQLAESEFALEWMPDPWNDVDRSGEWLAQLENQFKPDVIHLNSYALAARPWRAPVVSAAHSCVYSWWKAVHNCVPGADWEEYKRRVAAGLDAADAIAAPSSFMAQAVAVEYNLPIDKIDVIHNFSLCQPIIAAKQPYLLAAGRMWDKAKNLALLDSVAATLKWPLSVAGSGQLETSAVHCLGNLTRAELLAQMAEASIFVHPALYEPFGLAVLEAARAGCCLVLSDIPSMRELWADAAIFLDPTAKDDWTKTLNALIDDPAERTRLARRASLHAARYRADLSLAKYLNLYATAIQRKIVRSGVAA